MSDDSLAFCPTMYNRVKSEVSTVKHVEALQFLFLVAQISSIVFLNVKTVLWCVGGGGGGGGVKTL